MIMTNSSMGGLGGGMTGGGLLNNMKQPLLGGPGGPHGLHHSGLQQQNGPMINARVGMAQPPQQQQQQHMGPRGANLMGGPRMQAPPGMQLGKSISLSLFSLNSFTNQKIL